MATSSILLQPDIIVSSSSSISSQKRITFAPLPEPRTIPDPDALTEDTLSASSSSSSQLSPTQGDLDKSSPDSSGGSSPITQFPPLPTICLNTVNNDPASAPQSSSSWVKKPLRPFKRLSTTSSSSSSNTLTPTTSIDSHTRTSCSKDTSAVISLFRTSSRESSRSSRDNNPWSLSLARWTGLAGSNSSLPTGSSPLSRIQSTQSSKSKNSSRFSSSSSLSLSLDSKTKSQSTQLGHQPTTNRHKGTRMLNGRVYGAKKNTNPFANARDEEPEFVEWGYGGMGSVKGAKSAGVGNNWDRLQGGSAMGTHDKSRIDVGVGGVSAGMGATDVDLDDGSGLAWVKRRKAERERKAREEKEREKGENVAEKEISESQDNTPIPTRSATLESIPAVLTIPIPPSAVAHIPPIDLDQGGVTPSRHPSQLGVSTSSSLHPSSSLAEDNAEGAGTSHLHNTHENERVLQAITVPVRAPRLPHRQPSRGSREVLDSLATESPSRGSIPSAGDETTETSTVALHTPIITSAEVGEPSFPTPYSSSDSESESDVDDGDDEDDDDDDDDDDESQKQKESRETTLGTAAGVEKISRHKE